MHVRLNRAIIIIAFLKEQGIDPILYGSIGASVYLGNFKEFGDIDFLLHPTWLNEKWDNLVKIMKLQGYALIDLHEHEFKHGDGTLVAFADEEVLIRDKILKSLDEVVTVSLMGEVIRTLIPSDFKKAYLFSEKDGYRKNKRNKKDREIIKALENYTNNL